MKVKSCNVSDRDADNSSHVERAMSLQRGEEEGRDPDASSRADIIAW